MKALASILKGRAFKCREIHSASAVLLLLMKFMCYAKFKLSSNVKNSDCENNDRSSEETEEGEKDGQDSLCR